jgi:dihydroxyacetone kinase
VKKVMNAAEDFVEESLSGIISAYSRYYERVPGVKGLLLKQRRRDKVTMVIGGGSGHEPLFTCFVGKGLGDAAACGNLFASPDPATIYKVAKAAYAGKGILFLYGNYAGDNMNFDMAEEMLQDEGIKTAHIRVWDDCASAPPERTEDRRGIAGDVFMMKIAGAACDSGLTLEEVLAVCENASRNLRSIGVATSPGTLPGSDKPMFELGENEIEYGMGVHGEPGVKRTQMEPADKLAEMLYKNIMADMPIKKGSEVCVLVNSLGTTTVSELGVVYKRICALLGADGISIHDAELNNFCTSQDMGGFSLTVLVLDDELKKYYDLPCYCPYYSKEGR